MLFRSILETTYEGTKKVKDTKLQMLTTRFAKLKMSEEKSFDSFYGKLNEVVIGKFNLGEKTEDSKIVRKILRSLLESFRAKVTAIEESKDLDDIKVQELIGSLQTYELSSPSKKKSKSLALKTINERMETHNSSNEDEVEKDVAYLAKNFRKFLKFKAVFGCYKTFSGKYIFFGNANFRKRKIFPWCLVAFQKIFRKIFSGVWKRRKENTNPEKHKPQPRKKSSTTTNPVR